MQLRVKNEFGFTKIHAEIDFGSMLFIAFVALVVYSACEEIEKYRKAMPVVLGFGLYVGLSHAPTCKGNGATPQDCTMNLISGDLFNKPMQTAHGETMGNRDLSFRITCAGDVCADNAGSSNLCSLRHQAERCQLCLKSVSCTLPGVTSSTT